MTGADLLVDVFGRIRETVHEVVEGLSPPELAARLDDEANSIAWLVWHLTRVQDDHVSALSGSEQVWASAGWMDRFGLSLEAADIGYGHDARQVASVTAGAEALCGYHDAVSDMTGRFVARVTEGDLDRIVDERWDPPVTMGVRLVSVVADGLQHVGQAAFVRGILGRR